MDNETVCSSCVSVYFGVFFYNYALVYRTWDGAVVSQHSSCRYFQTPELRMGSYLAPSFSCIYTINRRE